MNGYLLANGEKKSISTNSNEFNCILVRHMCNISTSNFNQYITGINLAICRRIRLNLTMNINVDNILSLSLFLNSNDFQFYSVSSYPLIDRLMSRWSVVFFQIENMRVHTLTLVTVNGALSSNPPCKRKPHGIFPSDRLIKTLFIWSASIRIKYPRCVDVRLFLYLDKRRQ